VGRVYCNSSTATSFELVFEGLFASIKQATGRELVFKVFDSKSSLLTIHMDMEAAQVQGLGRVLVKMANTSETEITSRDPDILVQYVLKLCKVHYLR
jgi:hypothetical protein